MTDIKTDRLAAWFNSLPDGGMGKEHFDALLAIVAEPAPAPAESGAAAWLDLRTADRAWDDGKVVATNPQFVENNGPENFGALYLASPAPSASMGRVTVKALEWSSEPPYSVARVPRLWLFYSTEAVWDDRKFCYAELSGGLASGRFETVAAAKAAAQADYEARILAALDSPPDHGGGEGSQP